MLLDRHQYFHCHSNRLLTVNVDIFALLWKRLPTSLYPGHLSCHLWKKKRTGQVTNTHSSKDEDGFKEKWWTVATDSPYREWTAFTVPHCRPENSLHTRQPCQLSAYKTAIEHPYRNSLVCCRLHNFPRKDNQYQMCTRKIIYNKKGKVIP